MAKRNLHWNLQQNKDLSASLSCIPRYSYKEPHRTLQQFQDKRSFGPLYQATMPTGELVAVKVLAGNSIQGEKELPTEVLLLSRLHHRNLVNLVGYCVDKSQLKLINEFMVNGNLASLSCGRFNILI
ncbi:hypothetical protein C4D60_Mb07t07220 [Musa balbisiana]|uniref:Protein kinase domain-containing protein n=1 Tax=Musa balbisiana TaxID=52838 RepID=A0A4S8JER7_MUSBA|nr:hypothetical protein C4D60_Mb07t07220 [Musa balbisiana]